MMWMPMKRSSAHRRGERALGERQEDGHRTADEGAHQRDQLECPGRDCHDDGEGHTDDPAAEPGHHAEDRRHEQLSAHVAADDDAECVEGEVGLASHASRQQVDDSGAQLPHRP